jgi:hypothetical protein
MKSETLDLNVKYIDTDDRLGWCGDTTSIASAQRQNLARRNMVPRASLVVSGQFYYIELPLWDMSLFLRLISMD